MWVALSVCCGGLYRSYSAAHLRGPVCRDFFFPSRVEGRIFSFSGVLKSCFSSQAFSTSVRTLSPDYRDPKSNFPLWYLSSPQHACLSFQWAFASVDIALFFGDFSVAGCRFFLRVERYVLTASLFEDSCSSILPQNIKTAALRFKAREPPSRLFLIYALHCLWVRRTSLPGLRLPLPAAGFFGHVSVPFPYFRSPKDSMNGNAMWVFRTGRIPGTVLQIFLFC